MTLFYFALIASGIVLFLNDKKELNKLFTAVDTYRKPFKTATFFYISFCGMFLVPLDAIDLSLFTMYAVVYLFIGIILYELYNQQPTRVLTMVSLLHILGIVGRLVLEWTEWTPSKLFNIVIYTLIIPLYIYIIQLVLTLKRFSSD